MRPKIAVITATRAEYGLLHPLIEELMSDKEIDCHVIVSGTHLLHKYGYTVDYIRQDGIPIQHTVHIMEEEGNDQCKVIAKAMTAFSDIYNQEKYDAIVVLGDRYELYGFCIPALLHRIPIVHIHGGEKTKGAVDEQIRHSLTKMASIHFPSIEEYAARIRQMGENPAHVHTVGALGIDNVLRLPLMSQKELEADLGIDFSKQVAVVTFHPVTLDGKEDAKRQAEIVFGTLTQLPIFLLITAPNSDEGGEQVAEIIRDFVNRYPEKSMFVKSLGQIRYLSCLKYASIVIGNSSSGILETASFGIPAVDIGERQMGRFAPGNVIHCDCNKEKIEEAVAYAFGKEFGERIKTCVNPYGDGRTAWRIKEVLKRVDWKDPSLVKKDFRDISIGDIDS